MDMRSFAANGGSNRRCPLPGSLNTMDIRSLPKAVLHASWRLLRCLVLRLGALDGPPGWAVAGLLAHGTFLKWLALWELGVGKASQGSRDADRAQNEPGTPGRDGSESSSR